jgi:hypothetical protein
MFLIIYIKKFDPNSTAFTRRLREKEADLSSKTFEVQAIETECKVYKQRLNDIALNKTQEKQQVSTPDSTISTITNNSSDETN